MWTNTQLTFVTTATTGGLRLSTFFSKKFCMQFSTQDANGTDLSKIYMYTKYTMTNTPSKILNISTHHQKFQTPPKYTICLSLTEYVANDKYKVQSQAFQSDQYIIVLDPLPMCINLFSKLQIPILPLMDERGGVLHIIKLRSI